MSRAYRPGHSRKLASPFYDFTVHNDRGEVVVRETLKKFESLNGARSHAGTLSKKHNAAVDLAYSGDPETFAERYITTANPAPTHITGYRFERLV